MVSIIFHELIDARRRSFVRHGRVARRNNRHALATGFYVLGVEKSLEICDQIDNLGVVFVLEGNRSGTTNIVATAFRMKTGTNSSNFTAKIVVIPGLTKTFRLLDTSATS